MKETNEERSERILKSLKSKYQDKECFEMNGDGTHFVCELEPTSQHPEYDRAVEVIISSKPHKHLKMTQTYTVLIGTLELHDDENMIILKESDKYTVQPNHIHWATSDEAWVEIYSEPGWTKEDHIPVKL